MVSVGWPTQLVLVRINTFCADLSSIFFLASTSCLSPISNSFHCPQSFQNINLAQEYILCLILLQNHCSFVLSGDCSISTECLSKESGPLCHPDCLNFSFYNSRSSSLAVIASSGCERRLKIAASSCFCLFRHVPHNFRSEVKMLLPSQTQQLMPVATDGKGSDDAGWKMS